MVPDALPKNTMYDGEVVGVQALWVSDSLARPRGRAPSFRTTDFPAMAANGAICANPLFSSLQTLVTPDTHPWLPGTPPIRRPELRLGQALSQG